VPDTSFSIRSTLYRLSVACLVAGVLSSCMTGKKADDGAAPGDTAAAETEGLKAPPPAETGKAASTGQYVDTMITKAPGAPGQHQAKTAPAGAAAPPAATANGFPPAPAPAQPSGSIAGLATQPTGVRAGSFSIFSAAPAPQAAGSPSPGTGISATTGSMFTPRQPLPPANCTTDAAGFPVNC
jgi:hypothetical protein